LNERPAAIDPSDFIHIGVPVLPQRLDEGFGLGRSDGGDDAVISLSVSLSGSIFAPLVAKPALRHLRKRFAFAGSWIRLANTGLAQIAYRRGQLKGPLEPSSGDIFRTQSMRTIHASGEVPRGRTSTSHV
jgi:hypothetical protein